MFGLLVTFAGLGFWWVGSGSGVVSADRPIAEGEAPVVGSSGSAVLHADQTLEPTATRPERAAVGGGPEPVVSRALRHSRERGTAHGICISSETGEPAVGVPVEVVVLLKRETALTDGRGRFAFNVPSGPAVWIELGSATPWILDEPKILLTQAQQDGLEEIRLVLQRSARVAGRVVDEVTREPVPEVDVLLTTESRYTDSVPTDAGGGFVSYGGLPHEEVQAEIYERGVRLQRDSWLPFRAPEAVTSEWDPSSPEAWVIAVPIGPTYTFDLGEEPIGELGCRLLGFAESGEVSERGSWQRLREGLNPWVRFTRPVRPGSDRRFAVEVGTRDRSRRATVEVESVVGVYPRVLKVELGQTAGLEVQLVDLKGEPVQARAQLVPLAGGAGDQRTVASLHRRRRGLAAEGLEPGPWRLVASVGAQRFTRDVTIRPGNNDLGKWPVTIVPGELVRGTLSFEPKSWLFDDMNPRVMIHEAATQRLVSHVEVADSKRFFARKVEATFESPPLPPGEYTVRVVSAHPWEPDWIRCRPGDGNLEFTRVETADGLHGGALFYLVDDETGLAVEGGDISLTVDGVQYPCEEVEEFPDRYAVEGLLRVGALAEWAAVAPGYEPSRGELAIPLMTEDSFETVEVRLRRGWGATFHLRAVEDRVTHLDDEEDGLALLLPPLADVRVVVDGETVGRTDRSGSFGVSRSTEPTRIEFQHPDWVTARAPGGFRDGQIVGESADVVVWMRRREAGR